MAQWIDPIFDRTQADVDFAIRKIAEWVATDGAMAYDLKGCVNVSDINRIEGNIAFLSEKLTELHYPPDTAIKTWSRSSMPTAQDIERILYNVKALITAFYKHDDSPDVPSSLARYSDVNAVEENLHLIKYLLDIMVGSFRKSGTFQSGSTMFLPIRR